jgi:hypothetical protein
MFTHFLHTRQKLVKWQQLIINTHLRINTKGSGQVPPGWGLDTKLMTLLCKKKITVVKSKEVKTGWLSGRIF